MTAPRRAAVAALVVVAYVGSAALSGHLSPLARRPLLDGLAPPEPYRWVDPPAALAAANVEPTPGTFTIRLSANGSRTAVFTTDDAQITLILARGAFAPAPGQRSVEVTMTPIAPSRVSEPEPPLRIVGNVVRIRASYVPSGDPIDDVGQGARIVLVYPFTLNEHGAHTIVVSGDGRTWITPDTNDLPSIQQADALIETLGYVAVARNPAAATSTPASGGGGGSSNVATIVIVVALVLLSIAAAVTLRGSRDARERGR